MAKIWTDAEWEVYYNRRLFVKDIGELLTQVKLLRAERPPEVNEAVKAELLQKVTDAATCSEDASNTLQDWFDYAVHDVADDIAAGTNNGGFEGQIEYLLRECGEDGARSVVAGAIEAADDEEAI